VGNTTELFDLQNTDSKYYLNYKAINFDTGRLFLGQHLW